MYGRLYAHTASVSATKIEVTSLKTPDGTIPVFPLARSSASPPRASVRASRPAARARDGRAVGGTHALGANALSTIGLLPFGRKWTDRAGQNTRVVVRATLAQTHSVACECTADQPSSSVQPLHCVAALRFL